MPVSNQSAGQLLLVVFRNSCVAVGFVFGRFPLPVKVTGGISELSYFPANPPVISQTLPSLLKIHRDF